MRMRYLLSLLLSACTSGQAIDGEYLYERKVSLSADSSNAVPDDCFELIRATYRLDKGAWVHVQSLNVAPRCMAQIAPDAREAVRGSEADSGTYRVKGDTLLLSVPDTRIGEHGLVASALRRGDTLQFLGTDVQPVDLHYVRQR